MNKQASVKLWFILATVIMLAGCAKQKIWTEEVKLSNNSIIVIDRIGHYIAKSENNLGFGWTLKENELRLPAGSAFPAAVWKLEMVPIILDFDEEKQSFIIIAAPIHSFGNFEYSLFVLGTHGWSRTSVDSKYIGRKRNLASAEAVERSVVDLAFKAEMDKKGGLYRPYTEISGGGSSPR